MAQLQKKSALPVERINWMAEFEKAGIHWEPAGSNEVKFKCPAHEDDSPSASMNTEKNLWCCHAASCSAKGDIIHLLALALEVERKTVIADLSTRYDLELVRTVNPETIEEYHQRIWDSGPLLNELYKRAVTDDDIRKRRLGWHQDRITIPILNEHHQVINVRKYMPGAPGHLKMKNIRGYSSTALYPIEQLGFDRIWVCGGELKAIVAARILNPLGIGAICVTAGEGSWEFKFNEKFKDKTVFVCMDVDQGGRDAAIVVAKNLAHTAATVYILDLPLDLDRYPKGDINDWVAAGASTEQFEELMGAAKPFYLEAVVDDEKEQEILDVSLVQSTSSKYIGFKLRTEAVIQAIDTTPYLLPKTVACSCTRDQDCCIDCPVRPAQPDDKGRVELRVRGTAQSIISMVESNKRALKEGTQEALRIPLACKVVKFVIRSHYNVYDVRLTPKLHETGTNDEHVVQAAFLVRDEGETLDVNTPHRFTGKLHAHPNSQQAVLVFDTVEQSEDNLSVFKPSVEDLKELLVFRPQEWTVPSLQEHLDFVFSDLEANVTRIFHRRDFHIALSLAYFSGLYFTFDSQKVNGWVNLLVLGDSSQGKTEASSRLIEHYGFGSRYDCKNATTAGLLGGAQEMSKRWFISWGVIPMNDRRLVVLEELKGASTEVIGALTDMRSSGIAQIVKIETRKAHARTRLIMISNPRSDRPLSTYNFGVEAVKELIGSLEDIRRFDLVSILSAQEIDPKELNLLSTLRPKVEHTFTAELCRRLLLWVWTRTSSEIEFEDDATTTLLQLSTELCKSFSESMPLCDRGTIRFKLARLSVALAAMTFSTGKGSPDTLLVRKCHVEFVYQFLKRTYSRPAFGYRDYSRAAEFSNTLLDEDIVRKQIKATKYPADLVRHLLHADSISLNDLSDWCEIDQDSAKTLLSLFVRKNALVRKGRAYYYKTPNFIDLLKDMRDSGLSNEPTGIEEDEF